MYGAYFDSSKAQGIVLDTVSTNIKYAIGENIEEFHSSKCDADAFYGIYHAYESP